MLCPSMPRPISTALILMASSTLLCACSPAAQNENGRVPGGTNQQEAINAAGDMGGANAMPGIGAPGAAGNGTQP